MQGPNQGGSGDLVNRRRQVLFLARLDHREVGGTPVPRHLAIVALARSVNNRSIPEIQTRRGMCMANRAGGARPIERAAWKTAFEPSTQRERTRTFRKTSHDQ